MFTRPNNIFQWHKIETVLGKQRRRPFRLPDCCGYGNNAPAIRDQVGDIPNPAALDFWDGDKVERGRSTPVPDFACKFEEHGDNLTKSPIRIQTIRKVMPSVQGRPLAWQLHCVAGWIEAVASN